MSATSPDHPALPGSASVGLAPRGVAAMLALALLWGLSIPITKLGLETMPPMTLTALRFAVAVSALLICSIGKLRMPLAAVPKVVGLGLLGIGIGNVSQTFGVVGTSASVATVISATIPVFIVVLAAHRLGQSVTLLQRLGLAFAFAGIALVAAGQDNGDAFGQTTLTGAGLMLLSALAVAIYYVWSVELTAQHGTLSVVTWSSLAGAIALLPWTAWEISNTEFTIGPTAIASVVYLGLMVSVVGLFLWLWLLRTVPASVAASVQFLQPVFGIGASTALFGDSMAPLFIVGVVLVLSGVGLSMVKGRG
ncbi:DMT family transporter [Prosthecomicrobium hirschii]|uniref:DMT family transporter n=1 Tax=Prosthecodimorpha hirschii TaxID=665126 RepID=UPI00221E5159|nr:DMT family transporter [Prosthecomicrobium hirschii]MCW1842204.1 DMT family transporter [Prosthecomicrobium hirschii]